MGSDRGRRRVVTAAQLGRYVLVGATSTGLNSVLFLLLRTWWDTLPATLSALVLSTLVSTELNRRFTFAAHRDSWRAHLQTAATVAFYACYSTLVLGLLGLLVDTPSAQLQSLTLAVASIFGGLGRYLLLRHWVFPDATAEDRLAGAVHALGWRQVSTTSAGVH